MKIKTREKRKPELVITLKLSLVEFEQLFSCVDLATDNLSDLRDNGNVIGIDANDDVAMNLYSELSDVYQAQRAGDA